MNGEAPGRGAYTSNRPPTFARPAPSSSTSGSHSYHQRGYGQRNYGSRHHHPHQQHNHHHQPNHHRHAPWTEVAQGPPAMSSSRVTPFTAAQSQPGQHGATVVRSGSTPTEGGSIFFFSSVQKRGGAFTKSEGETYGQLQRKHVIQRADDVTKMPNMAPARVSTAAVEKRFSHQVQKRTQGDWQRALHQVRSTSQATKRSRFEVSSDEDEH